MTLHELEATLRERLAGTLPGLEAHLRFVPRPPRPGWPPVSAPPSSRTAAALILMYPATDNGEPTLVLTVRADNLARHSGQVSLPGGVVDPGESLAEAALREAREEIGVDTSGVRVLGELSPMYISVSGFTLHPVIGIADRPPAFTVAEREVARLLEVSLSDLRDASRVRRGIRKRDGADVEIPYFDFGGEQVWGATAMILSEFLWLLEIRHDPWAD